MNTAEISLEKLLKRLMDKKVSCFLEVIFARSDDSCIIFFKDGEFVGASYSWGKGGLNPSKEIFKEFLHEFNEQKASFTTGLFETDKQLEIISEDAFKTDSELPAEEAVFLNNLPTAMQEFFDIYIQSVRKKIKVNPVDLLLQRLVVRADEYPFLDPFNPPFDYHEGNFTFSKNADRKKTAKAIIDCAWDVVLENRVQKKFSGTLAKWPYKRTLEDQSFIILR